MGKEKNRLSSARFIKSVSSPVSDACCQLLGLHRDIYQKTSLRSAETKHLRYERTWVVATMR